MKYIVLNKDLIIANLSTKVRFRYEICTVDDKTPKYIAIHWDQLKYPIVLDVDETEIAKLTWCVNEYAKTTLNSTTKTMHGLIMQRGLRAGDGKSVDHINEFKLDNRRENLRIVTQSDQNSNRVARSDKKDPPQELMDANIMTLPRHVRWDSSEKKFVIEKHPALLNNDNKKPMLSGTKSTKLTVVEKYQDIMFKLNELDKQLPAYVDDFKDLKKKLHDEYLDITNCIREYNGLPPIEPKADPNIKSTIEAESKTIQGRKVICKLPEGCGVTVSDIPKHCYYKAAHDIRGDAFIIERHPLMKEQRRSWMTSSSTGLSTAEKFNQLMQMLSKVEKTDYSHLYKTVQKYEPVVVNESKPDPLGRNFTPIKPIKPEPEAQPSQKSRPPPRTEDHSMAIARSQRLNRAATTDDEIDIIRGLLREGRTQQSIIEEMGLGRHVVNRIANGYIVKSTELTDEKVRELVHRREGHEFTGAQRTIIKKRTVNVEEAYALCQLVLKESAGLSVKKLAEKWNSVENNTELSDEQLKGVIIGRTVFFPEEFSESPTYEEFQDIRAKIREHRGITAKIRGAEA